MFLQVTIPWPSAYFDFSQVCMTFSYLENLFVQLWKSPGYDVYKFHEGRQKRGIEKTSHNYKLCCQNSHRSNYSWQIATILLFYTCWIIIQRELWSDVVDVCYVDNDSGGRDEEAIIDAAAEGVRRPGLIIQNTNYIEDSCFSINGEGSSIIAAAEEILKGSSWVKKEGITSETYCNLEFPAW